MRVIVLGGAGDMGSQAVEALAVLPDVRRITIADRNAAGAEALARRLAGVGPEIVVRALDARDYAAVVEAMRGHDVVASALGPYYFFESPMVRAALESGVDYVSICDDWIAARDVLEQWDEPARRQGRRIVIGMGASPGLSNLAVRYLAGQMDRPLRVTVTVYQPPESGHGMAVLQHVLFIYDEVFPDGQMRRTLAPFQARHLFRYEGELLLDKAGYTPEQVYGSYDLDPYESDSERMIFVARKEKT